MPGAFFTAWDFPPVVCAVLGLVAVIYTAGFLEIRETRPLLFPVWRWWSFIGGVLALVVAVASPLDTFSDRLLVVHMGQHFVLMSVAPPLVALGAPVVPMLRGLPRWFVRPVLGPLIRVKWLRAVTHALVQPKLAWLLMNLAYVAWHVPAAYEAALANENIHNCEHACFFFTSVLFWWPIVEPWPNRLSGSRWILLPYLLSADVVNTGVSAALVFAGRLVYPSYGLQPRMFGLTALQDQAAAGAFMWVIGSIVFLIPAFAITLQLLSRRGRGRRIYPERVPAELRGTSARISRL